MNLMDAFYEGLFSALSNKLQAENYQPSFETNLIDYYLSLVESYVNENIDVIHSNRQINNITAYLSAEITDKEIRFRSVEYNDHFGSAIKDFVNTIESYFTNVKNIIIIYGKKTYEIAKDLLIKAINTIHEIFLIAKIKFNEALQNGKLILVKMGEMLRASLDTIRQAFFASMAYASNAIKTIFTGVKAKFERFTIQDLNMYHNIPTAYFLSKIFNEFAENINEISFQNIKQEFAWLEDLALLLSKLDKKMIFNQIMKLNEAISSNKIGGVEKIYQLNKQFADKLLSTANEYKNTLEQLAKKLSAQPNNPKLQEEFANKYKEAINFAQKVQQYEKNVDETLGKTDPKAAETLKKKTNAAKEAFKALSEILLREHLKSLPGTLTFIGLDKLFDLSGSEKHTAELTNMSVSPEISNVISQIFAAIHKFNLEPTYDNFNKVIELTTKLSKIYKPNTVEENYALLYNKYIIQKLIPDYLEKNNLNNITSIIEEKLRNHDPNLRNYLIEKSNEVAKIIKQLENYKTNLIKPELLSPELQKQIMKLNEIQKNIDYYLNNLDNLQKQYNTFMMSTDTTMHNNTTDTVIQNNVIDKFKEITSSNNLKDLIHNATFKYSLFIAGAAGLTYYAYAIAKQMHPVYSLLKASGLAIGFIVVILAVKFAIEYSPALKDHVNSSYTQVKQNLQNNHINIQPEEAIPYVLVIVLGLLIGGIVYKTALNIRDARKAGEKSGKMIATI